MTHSSSSSIQIAITDMAHGGDGIGRIDGMVCFVAGALPDEVVRVQVYRKTKNALWGRLQEIVVPSKFRIPNAACSERPCAATCLWHDFAYPAQASWKQQIVAESIRRIGRINTEVTFVANHTMRHGYRTRAVFHGDGVHLGYYAPRTHTVMPLSDCPLNHQKLNRVLQAIKPLALCGNIHVTINPEGEETLVCMGKPPPKLRELFPLTNSFDERSRHQFIFDGTPVVNGTFSQASLVLNRMLRRETDKRIGTAKSLLDLYCGNGNLSLHHVPSCDVVGVDHAIAAIEAANTMAANVYRQGGEAQMATLIKERCWDVILLDPPRIGAKTLVDTLATAKAKRIIYVSCNPATFARDAHGLTSGNWRLISVAALDMFPHTPHVETIGVFEQE